MARAERKRLLQFRRRRTGGNARDRRNARDRCGGTGASYRRGTVMGTFTMPLKTAIELAPKGDIGLNDYPIFDEAYRPTLNKKITDRYLNREIGMETISLFRHAM